MHPHLTVASAQPRPDEKPTWTLLDGDGTSRWQMIERTEWRWHFAFLVHPPRPAQDPWELAVTARSGRFWPTEADIAGQAEQIRQQAGDSLHELLPWMPLLIVVTDQGRRQPRREALLALLFLHLTPVDDPRFRMTVFQLRRLAFHSLVRLYEEEENPAYRLELSPALGDSLFLWQEEIASQERAGFFDFGFPCVEERQPVAGSGDRVQVLCRFGSLTSGRSRTSEHASRERAMRDLLLQEARSGAPPKLRRPFREPWGQGILQRLIAGWFLPRYDLDSAERLKQTLGVDRWADATTAPVSDLTQTAGGSWFRGWPWQARVAQWSLLCVCLLMGGYFLAALVCADGCGVLGKVVGWGLVVCGLLQLPHWFLGGRPDTSLPRLRAGMFLAVVGTVLQQNWDNLLAFSSQHQAALLVIVMALAVMAFQVLEAKVAGALLTEERRRQGLQAALVRLWPGNWSLVRRRSWAVFWRGLALAFLLSLLLVDLLGSSYVEQPPEMATGWLTPGLAGIVGGTYPSLVLLFTGILLFAGVFGQLLWEEKPITEALV